MGNSDSKGRLLEDVVQKLSDNNKFVENLNQAITEIMHLMSINKFDEVHRMRFSYYGVIKIISNDTSVPLTIKFKTNTRFESSTTTLSEISERLGFKLYFDLSRVVNKKTADKFLESSMDEIEQSITIPPNTKTVIKQKYDHWIVFCHPSKETEESKHDKTLIDLFFDSIKTTNTFADEVRTGGLEEESDNIYSLNWMQKELHKLRIACKTSAFLDYWKKNDSYKFVSLPNEQKITEMSEIQRKIHGLETKHGKIASTVGRLSNEFLRLRPAPEPKKVKNKQNKITPVDIITDQPPVGISTKQNLVVGSHDEDDVRSPGFMEYVKTAADPQVLISDRPRRSSRS
jgi:hypothetical protein